MLQQSSERSLRISADKRHPRDLRELNRDAGLFFAFRYRGFRELVGRAVTWDVGKLFDFPELDETWRAASKPHWNRSSAKHAIQIRFFFELDVRLSNGAETSFSKQLVWKFNPNAISSELFHDWTRLVKHPLVRCTANRELISGKGGIQTIDLRNVRTLLPSYDNDRGSLVAVYSRENDLLALWPQRLADAEAQHRVTPADGTKLRRLFESFTQHYAAAVAEFPQQGLAAASMIAQMRAYSNLLIAVCRYAKGDRNREALLKPLLAIGAVPVEGGPVASIITPWQPLRMTAMAQKAAQVAGLLRHLLTAEEIFFGDTKLYFEELAAELDHPYYPEIGRAHV